MNQKYTYEFAAQVFEVYKDHTIPVFMVCQKFNLKSQSIASLLKRNGFPVRKAGFYNKNSKGLVKSDDEKFRENVLWFKRNAYRNRAIRKGLEFTLTDNDFIRIITSNCVYCGQEAKNETRKLRNFNLAVLTVDRKDNTKGYTLENCVSACKNCNFSKMQFSHHQYLEHIKKVYEHNFVKK